jgi:hypothetical protein
MMKAYDAPTLTTVGDALTEVPSIYKSAGGDDFQGCGLYCFSEIDD